MNKSPYIAGFNSSKDLLEKLKRERKKILNAKNKQDFKDSFFNFIITAHSLKDWIKKEFNSLDEGFIYKKYPELGICQDLANANKHFILSEKGFNSHRSKKSKKARLKKITFEIKAYGMGLYGSETYGGIDTSIETEESTKSYSIYTFIDKVIKSWKDLFNELNSSK